MTCKKCKHFSDKVRKCKLKGKDTAPWDECSESEPK